MASITEVMLDSGCESSQVGSPLESFIDWPVCEIFRRMGSCCLNSKCLLAHIPPEAPALAISDGVILICFDYLGLVKVSIVISMPFA